MFPWRLSWILCLLCACKIALTGSQANDDNAIYTYKVSVKTGTSQYSHAPTTNDVSITLHGDENTSPTLRFDVKPQYGSVDSVTLLTFVHLGDINCIDVMLSSLNHINDSWQFESITVKTEKKELNIRPNIRIYPGDSIQIASGKVECIAPRLGCGSNDRYQSYSCKKTCSVCQGKDDTHVYYISVKTSDSHVATTRNDLYLTLYGDLNISPSMELDITYKQGSLDIFALSSPWPLGEILCINVFLSSLSSNDYFFFNYVIVQHGKNSKRFPKSTAYNNLSPGSSVEYKYNQNNRCATRGKTSCGFCKVPTVPSTTTRKPTPTTSTTSTTTTTTTTTIQSSTKLKPVTTETTNEVKTTLLTKPVAVTTETFQPSTKTLHLTTRKINGEMTTIKEEVLTATGILRSTVNKGLDYTTDSKNDRSSTSRVDDANFRGQERQTDKGSSAVGIAAGCATGVLALAVIAGVTVFVLRRRRTKTQSPEMARPQGRPMVNPMYSGCDDATNATSEIQLDSKDLSALYAQPVKLRKGKTNEPDYGASDDQFTQDEDPTDLSELYSKPIKPSCRKNKVGGDTNRKPGSNFKQAGDNDGITIYQVAGDFNDIPDDVEYETNDIYSSDNDVTLVTNSLYGDGGDLNYSPTDVSEDEHVHFVENDIYEA